ncbi:MAG: DUF4149 domain-containing protein [Candidatus Obscuribacterales bacterium]|nr:DUF4149 domain-containing protein [Steroidobacteraceae bacterium]
MKARVVIVVMAAWSGSLWTICALVAPSLFAVLPDRHVAGELAGYFFRAATWLGVAFGAVVLALLWSLPRRRGMLMLAVATMLAPVLSEIVVRPLMSSARAAGEMSRFGLLHGVAALLFAAATVTALVLLWRVSALPPHALAASGKTIRG